MRPVPASISASCQGLWWQTGTSGFAVWPPGSRRGTYHTVQTGLSRGPSWYFHLSQSKCLPYWIFFSRKPHYSDSWVEIEKKYNNGLMLNWNKHKNKPGQVLQGLQLHAKFKIVQVAHRGNSYDNQYWIFITKFLHMCPPSILTVVYQIQINRNQQWLSLRIKYHLSFQMCCHAVIHHLSVDWLI